MCAVAPSRMAVLHCTRSPYRRNLDSAVDFARSCTSTMQFTLEFNLHSLRSYEGERMVRYPCCLREVQ